MSNYDKCIEMLCQTGKMPVGLIDTLCKEAQRQINVALETNKETRESRNAEIFGDRHSAYIDYRSAWLDYVASNQCNFSMD